MGKLSWVWKRIGDISLAQWLWQLLPATASTAIMAQLAYLSSQPPWMIGLIALAAFALTTLGIAGYRWGRIVSVRAERFDDLRARVRDRELAEMMGKHDAEHAFQTKVAMKALDLNLAGEVVRSVVEEDEIRKARHRARLKRIEDGEQE